jgi:hypothetical protein
MSELTLTKIRFRNGVWEGRITGAGAGSPPVVDVRHRDEPVSGTTVTEADQDGEWDLRIPVPAHAIADGAQCFVITGGSGQTLGAFTLIAGDEASENLIAEVELLRAELDMLKRAFRRHCLETM